MKRTILPALLAVALLAGCGASTSGGTAPDASTAPAAESSAPAEESSAPAAEEDGDWKIGAIKVKKNSFGYDGTMRVTNIVGDSRSATFTVTALDKSGGVVGTMSGVVNDVKPGKTVTVTLITTDDLKGATKYEAQVDASF